SAMGGRRVAGVAEPGHPADTVAAAGGARGAEREDTTAATPLLTDLAGSPGRASGRARILRSPAEEDQFRDGEVLVAEMTSPDWVPVMRRAAAIVTDSGGMTCHAAIVAREMGVPCVVGTRVATSAVSARQVVTVDGTRGEVYVGELAPPPAAATAVAVQPAASAPAVETTATRLYVNLAVADRAE